MREVWALTGWAVAACVVTAWAPSTCAAQDAATPPAETTSAPPDEITPAVETTPAPETTPSPETTPPVETITLEPAPDAPAPSLIARGRALGWGVDAIVPIYLGDVRQRDGVPLRYLNPGGGVEARIFYELPGGLGLGVSGGVMVHASESSSALSAYRGAVEARWVVDVGSPELAPVFALSIGVFIGQVNDTSLVTGYARVLAGMQWILAPWVALEGGVSLEGAIGADAFADAIAWLSPRIGVTFHE